MLSEACFLVRRNGGHPAVILRAVREDILQITFDIETEVAALEVLIFRYGDVPMSLADACLVRLTELHSDSRILTLDSDFRRYRRHGRQLIPLLAPW